MIVLHWKCVGRVSSDCCRDADHPIRQSCSTETEAHVLHTQCREWMSTTPLVVKAVAMYRTGDAQKINDDVNICGHCFNAFDNQEVARVCVRDD